MKKEKTQHVRNSIVASIVLLCCATIAASEPKLIPFWDASDETSTTVIDHGVWQTLLDRYLKPHSTGINRFNYGDLKDSSGDMAALDAYLDRLQEIDPRSLIRSEQKAYWINFYNALTIKVVTDAYPVDTIKDIHEGWLPKTGPWGDVHATVAGQEITLDNIEHGILRPIWRDPRIHYGVNCASLGCPNLSTTAFTAANTDELLDAAAREYVNHPRGVDFVDEDFVVVSSIYKWFVSDFGGTEETVRAHLIQYAEDDLAARLRRFEGAMDYEYDWSLNRP